jgi:replication-associated recombination protein RarA
MSSVNEKGDWTTGSFRPKTIDEMALYPELRDLLTMYALYGIYEHIIMVGSYGVGKTTAARILADTGIFSVIEVDCEEKMSASLIDKIVKQTTSMTIFGKKRLFVMDEFHKIPKKTQDRLKKMLEDRKENNKFIFCVNDYDAVAEGIKSRCVKLIFDVGMVSDVDNRFHIHKHLTDMDIDGWKQELKRIGKSISIRAGNEAPDEMIDKMLTKPEYIKDTRSFLIALQMQINIQTMKNKT